MKQLGIINSSAEPGTLVYPRTYKGYISPDPVELTENGQIINFEYTPIKYNLTYNLNGGEFVQGNPVREQYTINDEYTPPNPVRANFDFAGWNPAKIEAGTIGDIRFVASWNAKAILDTASNVRTILDNIIGDGELKQICRSVSLPLSGVKIYNVSCTSAPIYVWYYKEEGLLMTYSEKPIYANPDSKEMFKGFDKLIDISGLNLWNVTGADITSMFEGCTSLANTSAINSWTPASFNHMLKDTAALTAGNVPSWYRYNVTVNHKSSSGIILETDTIILAPDQSAYASSFSGYNTIESSKVFDGVNMTIDFTYIPKLYSISYNLDGGELPNPKNSYTIEDSEYIPGTPAKAGYVFKEWVPTSIPAGSTGDKVFAAVFEQIV